MVYSALLVGWCLALTGQGNLGLGSGDLQRVPPPVASALVLEAEGIRDTLFEELRAVRESGDGRGMVVTLKEYAR